jgi:protease-4
MKDLISTIFNILRYAGRTVTVARNIIFNILFFALLIFIGVAFFSKKEVRVEPQSALLLSLAGNIVEQKQLTDPLNQLVDRALGFSQMPRETLLQDVLDAIHSAAVDQHISSIVLDLSDMGKCSPDQIRDIGSALETFKAQGKPVIAAEDFYNQNKYLLASYADKIFLNPAGVVELHGLGTYRLYFADALQKLDVNYNVFRVGTYKSALEPVTRNSMSLDARNQNSLWLEALWQEYTTGIMARRDISAATLERYTNDIASLLEQSSGDTAKLALDTNLVDALKTRQQVLSYLRGISGYSSINGGKYGFKSVSLQNYLQTIDRSYIGHESAKDAVGIIIAKGNIVPGQQPPGTIGSETLLQVIRDARNDQDIKAVVLRINSGGGSVFASEIIRRELQTLQQSGKPLIISMGAMAASGAYWIAAEADEIWAYPTTLTGSIGIFGALPTFEDSLAELGIYSDGIGTTELSSGLNLTLPLAPQIKKSIQLNVEHGYKKFLSIVARGRDMEKTQLTKIAEGRVFDGATAAKNGLVDKLGNLNDAVQSAAGLAGLTDYTARYVNARQSVSQQVFRLLRTQIYSLLQPWMNTTQLSGKMNMLADSAANLLLFQDPRGIYAHCMIHYWPP